MSGSARRKVELNQELENVLKAAIKSLKSSKDIVSGDLTQHLCNVVEAIFIHGLRDPFFLRGTRYAKYPEPNFWPFVSKFSHRAITKQISTLNLINTEIGKGRAWIRIVLNECQMEHYVSLLKSETTDIQRFYDDDAFLRDVEQVERMGDYMKGLLTRCPISSATNSSFLNRWTPTPLILAGLVRGQPIRIEQLTSSRKPSIPPDEVGVLATDLLPSTSAARRNRSNGVMHDSDDNGSVYSHPSLSERKDHRTPASSSPIEPEFERYEAAGGLIIERRRVKPRRNDSASSSGSNSQLGSMPVDCSLPTVSWSQAPIEDLGPSTPTEDSQARTDSGVGDISRNSVPISPESSPTQEDLPEEETEDEPQDTKTELLPPAELNESKGSLSSEPVQGSSLHDELLACSNSLIGKAWSIPQTSSSSELTASFTDSNSEAAAPTVTFGEAFTEIIQRNSSEAVTPTSDNLNETPGVADDADVEDNDEYEDPEEAAPPGQLLYKDYKRHMSSPEVLRMMAEFPTEVGLDGQNFKCPHCHRTIGCGYGKWKVCGVDALYYCEDCYAAEVSPIPSKVLYNWDHRAFGVSLRGKVFIEKHADNAILRLSELNPRLYEHSASLAAARKLRQRLQAVAAYLFSCRESVAEDLRRRTGHGSAHLLHDLDVYSFQDLLNVDSGVMERHLNALLKFAVAHVYSCCLCRQKGFLCEVCDQNTVLYPFEDGIERCQVCFSVFHEECMPSECPRCARRAARGCTTDGPLTHDHPLIES